MNACSANDIDGGNTLWTI